MTTEIEYATEDLALLSKMVIYFINSDPHHVYVKKVTFIHKVFSALIQDCIPKGAGQEVGHLGRFTRKHIAAWNYMIIIHLAYCKESKQTKEKIISLWNEIELIIRYQIRLTKIEEEGLCDRYHLPEAIAVS